MTTMTRDRATAAQERDRIMGSRNEFWRPEDLATSGSTTLHLLAAQHASIRRSLASACGAAG